MISLTELLIESISKTKIFEMAFSREKYLDMVYDLSEQIVENWCLIKYCNLYDEENYNRLHWSNELLAHMSKLQKSRVKVDKLKATKEVLINRAELNDYTSVIDYITLKWEDEKLPLEYIEEIAKSFSLEVENICKLLSSSTPTELKNYVYNKI